MSGKGRFLRIYAYLALMTFGIAGMGLKETGEIPEPDTSGSSEMEGDVLVVKVTTTDVQSGERLRALRQLLIQANGEKVSAIILDLDIAAGYSPELANLMLRDLPKVKVPVYSYANSSALGMGALLAQGSDAIYMSPVSVIGGATPEGVSMSGEDGDQLSAKDRQTVSILKAQARSLASGKGHRADIAEAMIDPDFELTAEKGDFTSKKGEVLTLTAEEATRLIDGKPLLADAVVDSIAQIVSAQELEGDVVNLTVPEWQRTGFRKKMATKKPEPKVGDEAEEKDDFLFGKADQASYEGKILIVKVGMKDLSSEARFIFMERVVAKARDEGASALIFDMHTPGGVGWYTTDVMMGALQEVDFPTYTFVNTKAKSAGALLAIATDHIYMKPTSTIGSALPVMSTGQDIPETMMAKVMADMKSTVRNVAIAKGHDPDLCVAFITTETEVIRDGVTICAIGEVLDLNAVEAVEIYNGEPLFAKGIVNSIEELIEVEELEGEVVQVQATPLEAFAQWTQAFSFLLIAFGLGGAYMELNSPGFGIPGFVSITCFTIFFFGNNLAGNMAGYETAVFFMIGLILLGIELLILGGSTMIVGFIGILLMLGSLGFALVDRVDLSKLLEGGEAAPTIGTIARVPAFTMVIAIILTAIIIGLIMKILPTFAPARRLVLAGALPSGTSIETAEIDAETGKSSLLGKTGKTITDLRPAGKAQFDGKMLDVTSDSEFIERDTSIKVSAVYGDRIVVERS